MRKTSKSVDEIAAALRETAFGLKAPKTRRIFRRDANRRNTVAISLLAALASSRVSAAANELDDEDALSTALPVLDDLSAFMTPDVVCVTGSIYGEEHVHELGRFGGHAHASYMADPFASPYASPYEDAHEGHNAHSAAAAHQGHVSVHKSGHADHAGLLHAGGHDGHGAGHAAGRHDNAAGHEGHEAAAGAVQHSELHAHHEAAAGSPSGGRSHHVHSAHSNHGGAGHESGHSASLTAPVDTAHANHDHAYAAETSFSDQSDSALSSDVLALADLAESSNEADAHQHHDHGASDAAQALMEAAAPADVVTTGADVL